MNHATGFFNHPCSHLSIINEQSVINTNLVIKIMVETYLLTIEADFQNFTLVNSFFLRYLEPNLRSFNIESYGDIGNFPNLLHDRIVLKEISVSGVYANTVHSSFCHSFY